MKVLSIQQPWASLIILGHKKIETRSWATKYRGPLLIHASAKFTKLQEQLSHQFYMETGDSRVYHCHRGWIIGMVNLVDVVPTDGYYTTDKDEESWVATMGNDRALVLTEQEEAFGDYSPGRYGWMLSDQVLFDEPIPAKGQLGLWNYDGPLPTYIHEQSPDTTCNINPKHLTP